ncbi:MAG: protease inhibitor I42 family protein [Candidatus Margulisbacteria bacterium]|jgi:inhibitor of cysteine peptidase|nr:protease inhibitor I42 family protein [Candidatus Margulisiibacteriota bacterium]
MKLRGWLFLILCVPLLAGCGDGAQDRTYKNNEFGFSVSFPPGYQVKPITWVKEETGAELRLGERKITIQALPTGLNYAGLTFDQYVRIAASVDIQNFQKLISLEPIISAYGISGYRTYWEVIEHNDGDDGQVDRTVTVGPLYYFPLKYPRKLGEQPVKAVLIYPDPALSVEAEGIVASFRYEDSFLRLLRGQQHGKQFLASRDKPFRIELAANPTTGYNWYIAQLDETRFKVRRSGYDPDQTGRVGGGGTSYWEIIPLKAGVGTIKLLYYRVWEGAAKAVDQFQVRVLVL